MNWKQSWRKIHFLLAAPFAFSRGPIDLSGSHKFSFGAAAAASPSCWDKTFGQKWAAPPAETKGKSDNNRDTAVDFLLAGGHTFVTRGTF